MSKKRTASNSILAHRVDYIRFLKDRCGGNVFYNVPTASRCHFQDQRLSAHLDRLTGTGNNLTRIEEKMVQAFELTKENLGKYVPDMTRRTCLKSLAACFAAAALPFTSSCRKLIGSSELTGPGATDETRVGIVREASVEESVRTAIDLAGGLDAIQPGDSVAIKPNCVWHESGQSVPDAAEPEAPVTTSPEVLRAVIRAVKERNKSPKSIFLADHSAILVPTLFAMCLQGMYSVAMEEGIQVLPWEHTRHTRFTSPHFDYMPHDISVSETVFNFDHFINVPVLKNHHFPLANDQAQFTGCLKAFVGLISRDSRTFGENSFHTHNLPENIAELNLCRPYLMKNGTPGVTMNIIDATSIIIDGGPHNSIFHEEMKVAHPNMIIAATDRLAGDSVAVAILKYYGTKHGIDKDYLTTPVWQQRQLVRAAELGLGIDDPQRIEVIGRGVPAAELDAIIRLWTSAG